MAYGSYGEVSISFPMATRSSDQIVDLHGDLELKILQARSLPNMDLLSEHLRRCFTACNTCRGPPANGDGNHHPRRKIITSDPYVTVLLAKATVAQTAVIPNSEDPCWDAEFLVPLAHSVSHVEFQVKDNDLFGADLIGIVLIPACKILSGESIEGWFPVIGPYGKPHKPDSALRLFMTFTPVDRNPLYQRGIAGDPQHLGVRHTYFPVRKGCSLTLYQDAHVRERDLPDIEMENGEVFQQEKCWEDICHAILEAHHLIYIAGWSVYHKVKLVREPTSGRQLRNGCENLNLGQLLKYKSEEGVRVLVLAWDDKTSRTKFFMNTVRNSTDKMFGLLICFPATVSSSAPP